MRGGRGRLAPVRGGRRTAVESGVVPFIALRRRSAVKSGAIPVVALRRRSAVESVAVPVVARWWSAVESRAIPIIAWRQPAVESRAFLACAQWRRPAMVTIHPPVIAVTVVAIDGAALVRDAVVVLLRPPKCAQLGRTPGMRWGRRGGRGAALLGRRLVVRGRRPLSTANRRGGVGGEGPPDGLDLLHPLARFFVIFHCINEETDKDPSCILDPFRISTLNEDEAIVVADIATVFVVHTLSAQIVWGTEPFTEQPEGA